MKIGLVTSMSGMGGTENVTLRLGNLLKNKKHDVYLFSGQVLLNDALKKSGMIHYNTCFYNGWISYFKGIILLTKCLKEKKINILHCQMARPVLACVIATFISREQTVVIWHSRGLRAKTYPIITKLFKYLGIFIIANCYHEKEKLIKYGFPPSKIFVTYNPLPNIIIKKKIKNLKDTTLKIGSLSRLSFDRNVAEAIYILRDLIKMGEKVHLIIAGDGEEKESLHKLACSLELTEHITFLGKITVLSDFFEKIDILINTFALEGDNGAGVGNNILEAGVFKVPVVVYDSCGIKEMVIDKKTGFCISKFDRERFVDSIKILMHDTSLRERMGLELHNHVKRLCSDDVIYNSTMEAYRMSKKIKGIER